MPTFKEHLSEIKAAFDDGCSGYRDEDALRHIRHEASWLNSLAVSGYQREKVGQAEYWADIYFSQRKHRKYSGGLTQVRWWFLEALDSYEPTVRGGGRFTQKMTGYFSPKVRLCH
jgi:hypothetical protein